MNTIQNKSDILKWLETYDKEYAKNNLSHAYEIFDLNDEKNSSNPLYQKYK